MPTPPNPSDQPKRRTSPVTVGGLILCVAGTFFAIMGSRVGSNSSNKPLQLDAATVPSYDGLLADLQKTDWYLYKVTASIRPGTDLLVESFVNRYLLPDAFGMESVGCNSTHLGGDYKVNFTAPGSSSVNNQVHWVNGPVLAGADVAAEWVKKILLATVGTTKSREGMGLVYDAVNVTSNAFMHNKLQFYVPTIDLFAKKLEENGVVHLKRKSTVASSATDTTAVEMGHLTIPVEAKTFEIVGPLASLSDTDRLDEYVEWSSYECPSCHHLAEDFETLQDRYDNSDNTTTWIDSDTGKVDGRPQPMLVSVHVAVSTAQTLDMMRTDFVHLRDYTNAKWEQSSGNDCSVSSLTWETMPGVVIKYVQNNHEDLPSRKALQEYERTWADEYEKTYGGQSVTHDLPSSANWHHFLDTHIGIISDSTTCDSIFAGISKGLRSSRTGYSSRDESGEIHLYVGYPGTTAWEYNLGSGCDTDELNFGDICGCVAENSVNVYNRRHKTDVTSCPKPTWATS